MRVIIATLTALALCATVNCLPVEDDRPNGDNVVELFGMSTRDDTLHGTDPKATEAKVENPVDLQTSSKHRQQLHGWHVHHRHRPHVHHRHRPHVHHRRRSSTRSPTRSQNHGRGIPCNIHRQPPGCEPRIKKCIEFTREETSGAYRVGVNSNSKCSSWPRLAQTIRSINARSNKYYVQFDGQDGTCYGIVMQGGECWGKPSWGNYDCMGRCGPGCSRIPGLRSNWGLDCLKHDVCTYFFKSSGLLYMHKHCGDEIHQADDDWSKWKGCQGAGDTCKAWRQ